jgi:lipid-A-disaccharide synthase-like uncharacterized protein
VTVKLTTLGWLTLGGLWLLDTLGLVGSSTSTLVLESSLVTGWLWTVLSGTVLVSGWWWNISLFGGSVLLDNFSWGDLDVVDVLNVVT